ncbi:unnamed protein product [Prorocentrum cordatum]|uniref:Anoctamin transmembrane domain-containing protein n=1 Tax=Prorocentrum cordatum TaxID=2364126 RepID=A0ABN9TYP3_9DINO|nr:unnamed protein product [Polarella glacialis]
MLTWFAGPLPMLFICLNVFAVFCYLQLLVWLWYDWGDCITLGCNSPDEKHGFIGVVAGISLDVGFGLVIVMIRALANLFGSWAATCHNAEFAIDRRIIAKVYTMLVEAVDTILALLLFGLLFVTPWSGSVQHDLPEADCSDAMLYGLVGRSSFSCLVRRVSVDNRRWVYRQMMRGPLMMLPFIRLLLKCVIPMVARLLNKYEVPPRGPCRCPSDAINALIRLMGLIFAFDGDSVGGFRFVFSGDPFSSSRKAAEAPPPASADLDGQDAALADGAEGTEQLLDDALEEMKLKEFEVDEEMNEVKLSLLFLVMFGPIAPEGVFTTLLAKMMESWFDLSKLLFLKRRPFPDKGTQKSNWGEDQGMSVAVMHFRMKAFIVVTIVAKVVWSFVLSFVVFA